VSEWSDDQKKEMANLKKEAQNFEFDKIKNKKLLPAQQDVFQDRLYKIINYTISRHDWYDAQRNQFLQIGLALMAVGASLGAILVNSGKTWYISIYTLALVIALVLSIFLSGLYQLYLYNKGIQRDYPYRQIADIRSWYFKYNFPKGLEDNLSKDFSIALEQVKKVKENLENFYDRILEYADDKNSFIKEDLEQVFILLLLQRYRNQQVKSMSNALFNSMTIVTILLVFTILAFIALEVPGTNLSGKNLQNASDNGTFVHTCSSPSVNLSNKIESSYLRNNSSKSVELLRSNLKSNIQSIRVLS
jgi:hypothetical protein